MPTIWWDSRPHIAAYPILTKEQYMEMIECVLKYKERGGKLDNEHWYEHVPEWVETSHGSEVNILEINKCQPTELSVTKSRTA